MKTHEALEILIETKVKIAHLILTDIDTVFKLRDPQAINYLI